MAADAAALSEKARAKVNLYLHLCGQRADGYHLLDSLAVFPDICDVVSVTGETGPELEIVGPYSGSLNGQPVDDNLVLGAARAMAESTGRSLDISLRLEKNLPVASGIGGGSSDAAAALRLLARLWQCEVPGELALTLGADVPVCLKAPDPTRMQGIGELLTLAPELPDFAMVLVNPGIEVPTGAVFNGVADKSPRPGPEMPERFGGFDDLVDWLAQQRNDLQPAAEEICPEIGRVLRSLSDAPLARMSGSGATCFGLFGSVAQAGQAAERLHRSSPAWWVTAAGVPGRERKRG